MDKDRRLKLSEYPEVMTIKDVCEFLAISRVTAYRFCKKTTLNICLSVENIEFQGIHLQVIWN